MTPSSIGQRAKCAMPKLPSCRTSRLSSERNSIRDALHPRLIHAILDERERHDVTTAETHSPPPGWQDLSLPACYCVPGVPGWTWAFCVHDGVSSFGDYR